MTSLNNVRLYFKVFDCTAKEDKVNQFLALLHDPDIKPVFNLYLEGFLATSELKILKRLAALEQVMGLNNMDLSEEHELTIHEQLTILADRIDNTQVVNKPAVEPENNPCLLYTSDAADEEDSVDLGGRRIIKKKKKTK